MITKFTSIREFMGFDIYQSPDGFTAIDSYTTKRFEGKTLNSVMTDIDEFVDKEYDFPCFKEYSEYD